MKLHQDDAFLTKGSSTLPPGNWRAAAIHPSSDVDLCIIGGYTLGVGSIVPLEGSGGHNVLAVRGFSNELLQVLATNVTPNLRIVLALYEECDPLVPLGVRSTYVDSITFPSGSIPTAVGFITSGCAFRVPFTGRRHFTCWARRDTTAADLNLVFRCKRYLSRLQISKDADQFAHYDEFQDSWWHGPAAPLSMVDAATVLSRTFHLGASSEESWDEIEVFVWGAAGGNAQLGVQASGELAK